MANNLAWPFVLRGILGFALAIVAIVLPGAALGAIVILIGAYFIVDGFAAALKAFAMLKRHQAGWMLLVSGALSVLAGVLVLLWPALSLLYLVYLVAVWAVFTGALEIVAAIRLRNTIEGEWLYGLFGALSIVFGVFVAIAPGIGLVYLVTLVVFYGFATGVLMLGTAWRLHRLGLKGRAT